MWPVIAREAGRHAAAMAAVAWAAAVALWRVWKPVLSAFGQLLLALVVIFEEWGWQPLSAALAHLARFKPWAAVERWISGLPPYGALAAFALPMTLLFPLKLLAVYLFASGKYILGMLLLAGAKITSTALVARIFMLAKPALMRIGWFAWAYAKFMPWEEAAMHWLRTSWAWRAGRVVKHRLGRVVRSGWARIRPRVEGEVIELAIWLSTMWPRWRDAARRAFRSLRLQAGELVRKLMRQARF